MSLADNNSSKIFIINCMLLLLSISVLFAQTLQLKENADTTYYQPAEIVSYGDTCVYFETPNNILSIETNGVDYPDTVPYLLHMDSMGTYDVSDDEIIVVWRCSE